MKLICTHPGRFGDILWALPTVRALAGAAGEPVTLVLSEKYGALPDLLSAQPYIAGVVVDRDWQVIESAPITPRIPSNFATAQAAVLTWTPAHDDQVYHLGYVGWPVPTLARDVYERAYSQWHLTTGGDLPPLHLDQPWITVQASEPPVPTRVWVAWTEEWFELKIGLLMLLATRFPKLQFWWLRPWGGRYDEIDRTGVTHGLADPEARRHVLGPNVAMIRAHWPETAAIGATCARYLGCLSSQWVLANALGIPAVVCEPNPHRHHPVFWEGNGGRNTMVTGLDGKPTFDARHVGDALAAALERKKDTAWLA